MCVCVCVCVSPAVFVLLAAHATQVLFETYSFAAQSVATHVVSDPEASSPAVFVVPVFEREFSTS